MNTNTSLVRLWSTASHEVRARQAVRQSQKSLERELATYRSESDRADLYATLSRYDWADTKNIHEILNRSHAA